MHMMDVTTSMAGFDFSPLLHCLIYSYMSCDASTSICLIKKAIYVCHQPLFTREEKENKNGSFNSPLQIFISESTWLRQILLQTWTPILPSQRHRPFTSSSLYSSSMCQDHLPPIVGTITRIYPRVSIA